MNNVGGEAPQRVRHRQKLRVGPWSTSGTLPANVFINDPVSGVNYILDSNGKPVQKVVEGKFPRATAAAPANITYQKGEAVQCEGIPATITIPAGEMRNDLPIEIVSACWYSPEIGRNRLPSQIASAGRADEFSPDALRPEKMVIEHKP